MRNYFVIAIVFFFFSCGGNKTAEIAEEQETAKADSASVKRQDTSANSLENKIMNAVMDLPEVKAANAHIDSVTNHKSGVAGMVDPPEQGETDYSVRVGYNGDERFEVYYFFAVNPATLKIKIMDVDSFIPIEDWRKQIKNN